MPKYFLSIKNFTYFKRHKKLCCTTDSREFSNSSKILALYVNLFPTLLGYHVINYINSNKISFLYDPTANIFPDIIGFSLLKYPNRNKKQPVWIVNSINNGIFIPMIKKRPPLEEMQKLKEDYHHYLEMFDKNIDMFEKFYRENKDIYKEINVRLSKVKEKKLY